MRAWLLTALPRRVSVGFAELMSTAAAAAAVPVGSDVITAQRV
jgi:hypothetical protein